MAEEDPRESELEGSLDPAIESLLRSSWVWEQAPHWLWPPGRRPTGAHGCQVVTYKRAAIPLRPRTD